jgi:hypothetical protein
MSTEAKTTKFSPLAHYCDECGTWVHVGDAVAKSSATGRFAHAECVPEKERLLLHTWDERTVFVAVPGEGWRPPRHYSKA